MTMPCSVNTIQLSHVLKLIGLLTIEDAVMLTNIVGCMNID